MANITGRISDLGRSALFTSQQGINVTGHNIANVNTPGYTRQRLILETNVPIDSMVGQIGTGVRGVSVERVYDRFIDQQIHRENRNLGRWEVRHGILEQAEIIFEGTSSETGINRSLNAFWSAWQDLSNNPTGLTERAMLLSEAETLAFDLQKAYGDLDQLRRNTELGLSQDLAEVNRLSGEVAELNGKIAQFEVGGQNANDFRDKRDVVLKDLSTHINVTIAEGDNGMVYVSGPGGRSLVVNTRVESLNSADVTNPSVGGRVGGWLEAMADIEGYMADLKTLSDGIMGEVNAIHTSGYDLYGDPGADFFTSVPSSGILAAAVTDPNRIAAAASASGVPGDSANAVAMADLQNRMVLNGNQTTIGEFYNALVGGVGNDVQSAGYQLEHQSDMVKQLENYRESVSGVSIDEELIDLVQFQNAYQAAAKLITTMDEMLDTVINMV